MNRTREIGLRKAVGAARRAILAQFFNGIGNALHHGWPHRRSAWHDDLFRHVKICRIGAPKSSSVGWLGVRLLCRHGEFSSASGRPEKHRFYLRLKPFDTNKFIHNLISLIVNSFLHFSTKNYYKVNIYLLTKIEMRV